MRCKPTKRQLDFMSWEFGAFFHFGIRTFCPGHTDWDRKEMDIEKFNPTDLDCKSWIETIHRAGMKYAILTAKHHDGFVNWPSKYTEYSVANTPWKNGAGDVVAEFVEACRAFDIKVGIYYSPADAKGEQKSEEEYEEYFINQISELLSNYGQIDYLWFDGCGSEGINYNKERIIHVMRSLQPEMLIFNMWDPDVRWVGNEAGITPYPCYYTVDAVDFSVMTDVKESLQTEKFMPVECDMRMRYRTWFWGEQDEDSIKSVDELMGIYDYSIGRGSNLLLNIAPDATGKLAKPDALRLLEFGEALKARFQHPVKQFAYPEGKEVRTQDEDFESKAESSQWSYELKLEGETLLHMLVLEEELKEGQSVLEFNVCVTPLFSTQAIEVYHGYQVGHKAICNFPAIVTEKVTIQILRSDGDCCLKNVMLYGK